MKAMILKQYGGVENFQLQEIDSPTIKGDEVLIKTKAVSINPVDVKTRMGKAQAANIHDIPVILGWDISGEVISLGKSVHDIKVGDNVFGMIHFPGHGKAYAEYVAAPASQLSRKPDNIPHEEAAASTLAALTAWQAMTKNGEVKAGDKVLIHAASGGVGHFAVQLAKHFSAYVIGTASAANKDFVLSLGADEFIDYRNQDFTKIVSDVDFILDIIGGENFSKSLDVLRPTGTIVCLPSGLQEEAKKKAMEKGVKHTFFMIVKSDGEDMKKIAGLLEKDIVKPHISEIYDFQDIPKAHTHIETGHTVGKVVVKIIG